MNKSGILKELSCSLSIFFFVFLLYLSNSMPFYVVVKR